MLFSFSEQEKFHTFLFQWKLFRWKMRKNSIDDKNYNPKPKININTQTNNYKISVQTKRVMIFGAMEK